MVNLELYRSFIEVYRVGTASGAAQVLHLTQPAVSQHLAALESALGTMLFERTPRKMLPTDAGKRLYNQIVAAMETLESVPTKIQSSPLIKLGTPQEFFSEKLLSHIPKENEVIFSVKFGLTADLIAELRSHSLDVVIATQKLNSPDIEYQLLLKESFWLVAPPETVLPISVEDSKPFIEWLKTQPWISYSEELPIVRRFWRVVFGSRIDVNPKLVIPDLKAIRKAIALGYGLSVLPDYLCEEWVKTNRLTLILKPEKSVTNQLWLAYRKSEKRTFKIKMVLDLMSNITGNN